MRRLALGILLVITLTACAGASEPAVPDSAIEIGRDLYMVPVGTDERGCTRYNLVARERETVQAVFYRDQRGDFTTNRADAGCR